MEFRFRITSYNVCYTKLLRHLLNEIHCPTRSGIIIIFSVVNDTAGHAAGNAVIAAIGSLLRTQVGSEGQVFRIGGDEFALLLQGDIDAVQRRAEAVRAAVERYRVGWQDRGLNVTTSVRNNFV